MISQIYCDTLPFMNIDRRSFLRASAAAAILPSVASRVLAQDAKPADQPKIICGSGSNRYECINDWIKPPAGMMFGDTHGLAQDKAGRIYLAQTVGAGSTPANAVCVYDANGVFLKSWGAQFAGGAHGLDLQVEDGKEFLYHCDTQRRCVEKPISMAKSFGLQHARCKVACTKNQNRGVQQMLRSRPTEIFLSVMDMAVHSFTCLVVMDPGRK
jgi:hypothetical protein